jgi:hypothetical protein
MDKIQGPSSYECHTPSPVQVHSTILQHSFALCRSCVWYILSVYLQFLLVSSSLYYKHLSALQISAQLAIF